MRRIGVLALAIGSLLAVAPTTGAQTTGSPPTGASVLASTIDADACGPTSGTRFRTTLSAVVTPNGAETTALFELTYVVGAVTVATTPAPGAGTEGVAISAQADGPGLPVRAELVTTNAHGTTRTPAALAFATPACVPPSATPLPPVPPTADTTAPTLTGVTIPANIKRGKALRMSFAASETATVKLVVERRRSGRLAGKSCRVTAARGKRCVRYAAVSSTLVPASVGAVTTPVPAGPDEKRLAAGRYRVSVTPTDAAGNAGRVTRVHVTVR